ncbi:UDP-galactopyranose mutase [Citrobacter sp. EC_71]|uniref:UDP-galactopyranose mutase n=1 Tax=unclassified Citrobacter TaxID=2644389 RepID=UPI0010C944F3|nr:MULTISPECIES: UDP-galactopyranose mutase [unclassified Citrobacter]MBW9353353.1 UDP-galactopyranose mutase [Citrobacter sp. EC_71]TKV13536.1 UDP-galactopyranose mutase [Citrobacter sp. wls615]
MYDYIIVGTGLFGSVCARELSKKGKKILMLEKRDHIGGNIYTENVHDIHVHKYGAHIFHTNDKEVWDYVNEISEFNRFTNSPLAVYRDKIYNLPFNMNTFYQLWGEADPNKVKQIIAEQRKILNGKEPENLEEKAISLVGKDIYEILIKGYTEKQWGRSARELPPFIIQRLPVRFTFDNNYFNDKYQGIPTEGYTCLIEKMIGDTEVRLNTDYLKDKVYYNSLASKVIYTGPIDAFYEYRFGTLEYRSLRFESEILNVDNFQGNAVINFTEKDVPYTRIIEHKHFSFENKSSKTLITREYPTDWSLGKEEYYPINDDINMSLFKKYQQLAKKEERIIFGGRLAEYKYYDMHMVIRSALNKIKNIEV